MSLLDNKLSALLPGSRVRLTNRAGQVIEGIVAENDGKEAVSIQVTTLATIRYDQIGMIDEFVQSGNIMQEQLPENYGKPITAVEKNEKDEKEKNPIVEKTEVPIAELRPLSCDKDTVSHAYKAMESEEKKAFEQPYNKFQSYLKSHEDSKCEEAIQLIWDIIDENEWDYNPRVNLFFAYVQLSHKEYAAAAESFFYADNIRYSYCAAYQGTDDDSSLYQLAAAFSTISLLSASPDELSEAVEVLRKSSVISKDITGVKYVLSHSKSADVKEILSEILRGLGRDYVKDSAELSDTDRLLARLKPYYPNEEIEKKIVEYLSKVSDTDTEEPDEPSEPASPAEPDITKEHKGQIVAYNKFEETGTVKADDGREYPFEVKAIKDEALQNHVKKIKTREFEPIEVKFTLAKYANKYVVSSLKRGLDFVKPAYRASKNIEVIGSSMSTANALFTGKDYTGAIEIYKQHMNDDDWEDAFSKIIVCYLALSNENEELGYLENLRAFVEKYVGQTTKNTKTLEALQQFYTKIHDYASAINVLNDLMELCEPTEHGRILHYIVGKERCYRYMKNYRSAVSEMLDWLEIVKRNKMTERHPQRDSLVYIELAELYFELEDYENTEKYIKLSSESERKSVLRQKLDTIKAERASDEETDMDDESYEDEEDIADEVIPEPEESLQTAYDAYTDTAGFDALDLDDTAVIANALNFDSEHLYCLLTYLNSADVLSADSKKTRTDQNGGTVYVQQAINAVNTAVSYAFNSPLIDLEYNSTEIIGVFDEAQKYLPDVAQSMFAASALYALFNPSQQIPDYSFTDLSVVVEEYELKQYPALESLMSDLEVFRDSTGYGMDSFAGYKTDTTVLQAAVNAAVECRNSVDERSKSAEQYVQLRQTREMLFSDPQGDIRKCLDIAADNRNSEVDTVITIMRNLFIRSGRSVSSENIDKNRLKAYIDQKYDEASDIIRKNGYQPSKQFKILVGKRANNLFTMTLRAITCICDWAAAAEHLSLNDNSYAKAEYEAAAPRVISKLTEIIASCEDIIANKGFDWGTESVRRAAAELLAKMNGTYSSKERRYFFIDFLKGEDILLNDSFLPEIRSSFCGMPNFNVLSRIERHASKDHPELHERFTEILSDVESKHNFRTARLIKAYGEDMGIKEITEHKNLSQYNDCLKQAKQRFETKCQDFSAELELCESYGTVSNVNGEKDEILAIAYSWYRISKITGDYGFYVRLLEVIWNDIFVKAAKKGEQLKRRLEDISSKPNYNFGVFSKEMIEAKINDLNYTSAEFIMGCILRGDVNEISDYSNEPFGYFKEFIDEYATNSRAVRGAGRNITDTIFEYSGKKDLEKALSFLTNNVRKETRGGANLLKYWIPCGGPASIEQITNLITKLGFKPVSVQPETSVDSEAYQVFCRKQIGKVNYVHHIPAFGSKSESEGFRVLCLYGTYTCDALMDKFRSVNATAKNTLVLLDFAMNLEERRRLARKIKEEKSFAKTFIVLDRVVLFYLAKHYAENTVIRRLMAVTLPFAYYQPFVEASTKDMPPELFTGREAELTSIESPDGANLVYGGRQLGKSALLKMAKRNIDRNGNGDRAVWIEIKDLTAAESLKVVCDKLITEDVLDESCQCSTWNELAGKIQRRLNDENPETRINYLLLLLDEADIFIETSGETDDQPITALKNLPSDRFKLVMAGLHNLSRYDRKSMHRNSNLIHLESITIRQFRREEATKLLTSILAYLGFHFTQKIIDNILASTYNYPGLIQLYCQKLLEAMKNEDYAGYAELNTPPYEVTESHYKKILSDKTFTDIVDEKFEATLFAEEKGRSNYHIIALILAYLYYTEPNEKGYTGEDILKIAEEYRINRITSLNPEQFSEILNEMCDLNVITVMDDSYRFATDGFRQMLGSQEKVEKSMGKYFEEDI